MKEPAPFTPQLYSLAKPAGTPMDPATPPLAWLAALSIGLGGRFWCVQDRNQPSLIKIHKLRNSTTQMALIIIPHLLKHLSLVHHGALKPTCFVHHQRPTAGTRFQHCDSFCCSEPQYHHGHPLTFAKHYRRTCCRDSMLCPSIRSSWHHIPSLHILDHCMDGLGQGTSLPSAQIGFV